MPLSLVQWMTMGHCRLAYKRALDNHTHETLDFLPTERQTDLQSSHVSSHMAEASYLTGCTFWRMKK